MSVPFTDQWAPNGEFGIVKDEDIEGGLRVIDWGPGGLIDTALNTQIPALRRRTGMIVIAREDRGDGNYRWQEMEWSGSAWRESQAQSIAAHGHGVIPNVAGAYGLGVTATLPSATLTVAVGRLVSWRGRVVEVTSPVAVTLSSWVHGGIYAICYRETGDTFVAVRVDSGAALAWGDMPLAVARVDAVNDEFDMLEDCRLFADGGRDRHRVTVGDPAGSGGQYSSANFAHLRAALLWCNCFGSTTEHPREIVVIGDVNEPFSTNFVSGTGIASFDYTNDPLLKASYDHLDGLVIRGQGEGTPSPKPTITFGTAGAEGYFLDFGLTSVTNVRVVNLAFDYIGDADHGNDEIAVFKNPGRGFVCTDCAVDNGSGVLTHFAYWLAGADIDLGGYDTSSVGPGTTFERLRLDSATANTDSLFKIDAGTDDVKGVLCLRSCSFVGGASTGFANVLSVTAADSQTLHVDADGLEIGGCRTTAFVTPAQSTVTINNTRFLSSDGTYRDVSGCGNAKLANCSYHSANNTTLGGVYYANCTSEASAITSLATEIMEMSNCSLALKASTVHNAPRRASNCYFGLLESSRLLLNDADETFVFEGCEIARWGQTAAEGQLLLTTNSLNPENLLMSNCLVRTAESTTEEQTESPIVLAGNASITGCRFSFTSRTTGALYSAISIVGNNTKKIIVSDCQFDMGHIGAIRVSDCESLKFINNTINMDKNGTPSAAIGILDFEKMCHICNNTVVLGVCTTNAWDMTNIVGSGRTSDSECVFAGNICHKNYGGGNISHHVFQDMKNCIVTGNRLGDTTFTGGLGTETVDAAWLSSNGIGILNIGGVPAATRYIDPVTNVTGVAA